MDRSCCREKALVRNKQHEAEIKPQGFDDKEKKENGCLKSEEAQYTDAHLDCRCGHCSGNCSIVCEVENGVLGQKLSYRDIGCKMDSL